jgi:hypothetical protein
MNEDSYEYSSFERNCPKVDDGFYLVKNGITYKVDLPMNKMRFTKSINILTGEVHYPSNGDRLRSMNDEELADFITDDMCGLICGDPLACEGQCKQKMLDWLKQEAKDG